MPRLTPPTPCSAGGSLNADKMAVAIRSSGTQGGTEELGPDLADALWSVSRQLLATGRGS